MRIAGQWCFTLFTEAKGTLDYVPNCLNVLSCIIYRCPGTGVLISPPLCYSSIPSSSTSAAAAVSLAFARSMSACSHHCTPIRAPSVFSYASHRSRSNRVEMYCADVFCLYPMYYSIVSKPASYLSVAAKVYYHLRSAQIG